MDFAQDDGHGDEYEDQGIVDELGIYNGAAAARIPNPTLAVAGSAATAAAEDTNDWGTVPLEGEEQADTLLPASTHDADNLANVRQRHQRLKHNEEARNALRSKRRTAWVDRIVLAIVANHFVQWLFPREWLEVKAESGERYPPFVTVVRDNHVRWWSSIAGALGVVASALYILSWAMGAPNKVVSGGTNVVNLWMPSTPYVMDFTSPAVADWITANKPGIVIRMSHVNEEYFTAPVYHASDTRNVTIDWVTENLKRECRPDPDDPKAQPCPCAAAIELGIMANIVLVDNTIMLNPHIETESDERSIVDYGDGTKASQPDAVIVEYLDFGGMMDRRKIKGYASWCVTRSLDLVGALHKHD